MTMPGLDVNSVRDAAFALRTAMTSLATVDDDLAGAASLAAISDEAAPARALLRELDDEIDLLQRLLDTKATAMELADAGFSTGGAWLMQQVSELARQLSASLGDDVGSNGSSQDVLAYYQAMAFQRAGIDPSAWDPAAGLDANADNVALVYEYYAALYRSDPDALWWAGMAAMIGPSFFGGFQDLEAFADVLESSADIAGKLRWIGVGSNPLYADLAGLTASEIAAELRWYQQRLLMMQKEIFLDMGAAHEAYRDGGMFAIERLYADDDYLYSRPTIEAWRQIDTGRRTGDAGLVAEGNATLLLREQLHVIEDDYHRMLQRPVTGEAVTYLMTAIGAPSVPGAMTYPDFDPLTVDASQYIGTPREIPIIPFLWHQSVPHAGAETTVTLETPLPAGNIARFEDRWALIEHDTLPVWTDLAMNHQSDVLRQLAVPVTQRARDFTLDARIDDLAEWALTGWDLDVDVDLEVGW